MEKTVLTDFESGSFCTLLKLPYWLCTSKREVGNLQNQVLSLPFVFS